MSTLRDSIHRRGRDAVLDGRELLDRPPGPGSTRWGLSLDVRLDHAAEQRLDALAGEAATLAGPGQWLTGGLGSSHLTISYLERAWREAGADDPAVRRYADIVARLAASAPPLRWELTGLVLADRGVLALATPVDGAPDAFRSAVLAELGGGLGQEEQDYRASTWWSTLLHFAAPVADRAGLVAWVEDRATQPPLPALSLAGARIELVRYAFDGARTAPVPLQSFPLAG